MRFLIAQNLPDGAAALARVRLDEIKSRASRRIGLVWRRGYPKAEDLSLLGALVRDEQPPGTHTVLVEENPRIKRNGRRGFA